MSVLILYQCDKCKKLLYGRELEGCPFCTDFLCENCSLNHLNKYHEKKEIM